MDVGRPMMRPSKQTIIIHIEASGLFSRALLSTWFCLVASSLSYVIMVVAAVAERICTKRRTYCTCLCISTFYKSYYVCSSSRWMDLLLSVFSFLVCGSFSSLRVFFETRMSEEQKTRARTHDERSVECGMQSQRGCEYLLRSRCTKWTHRSPSSQWYTQHHHHHHHWPSIAFPTCSMCDISLMLRKFFFRSFVRSSTIFVHKHCKRRCMPCRGRAVSESYVRSFT